MNSTYSKSLFGSEQPVSRRGGGLSPDMGNIQSSFPRYGDCIYNSKGFDEKNLPQFRILNPFVWSLGSRVTESFKGTGSTTDIQVCKPSWTSILNPAQLKACFNESIQPAILEYLNLFCFSFFLLDTIFILTDSFESASGKW